MKLSINQQVINMMLCTSEDETRACLFWIWYDSKGKRFVATDGHIARILPYDDTGDLPYPETDIYIRFPKINLKGCTAILDTETKILTPISGKKMNPVVCEIGKNEDIGPYPEIDKVIPTSERVYRVGVNVKMLLDLAKSINEDGKLELSFGASGIQAIEISSIFRDENKGRAIIMPLRVSESRYGHYFVNCGLSKDHIEYAKSNAIYDYLCEEMEG